jgi:hypothetical protein
MRIPITVIRAVRRYGPQMTHIRRSAIPNIKGKFRPETVIQVHCHERRLSDQLAVILRRVAG